MTNNFDLLKVSKKWLIILNCLKPVRKQLWKNFLFRLDIRIINLSLNELKLISKSRGIKAYKNKSKDELTKIFSKPESKINSLKLRIKETREEFNELRNRFSKPKIKEIRRSLYEIENKINLCTLKIKDTEKNLLELEKNLSELKKYYDYGDIEYKGVRDVRNLFNLSTDEDYYKPIMINNAFNSNYIEYESKGDKDITLSIEEYLYMIRPYLSDIINDHKTQGEWKIQLTVSINFMYSKDFDETDTMHTESDDIEIMLSSETDEIIEELFEYFLQKYQEGLEENMRGRKFVFDSVDLLYYELHKINLNRGGSYIDSPKWLKKTTINPKNNLGKCLQYALTVALNYQNIKNNPERITKINPFIDQYNWKEIHFPSNKTDWKMFELNNKSIALNILFVPHNTENIRHACKSKYNLKRENQVILLMITDGEKQHYLAVKKIAYIV